MENSKVTEIVLAEILNLINSDNEILGLYRHYKGNLYVVLSEGTHSETQERFVVYKAVATGKVWVRPFDMFFENVVVDGKEVPRFEHITP